MRSLWKGFFIDNSLTADKIASKKNYFKVWSRNTTISKYLLNKTIYVYNGKTFEKLYITGDMLGFKIGDFVFTRKYIFKQNLVKNKNKR